MRTVIGAMLLALIVGCDDKREQPQPDSQPSVRVVIGEKSSTSDASGTYEATSEYAGTRAASWFGQSPIQAVEKRTGLSTPVPGGMLTQGGSKGYGLLEQTWDTLKDFFWSTIFIVVGGLIVLVILLFIPATAPFAGSILRMLASVVPFIGSLVERLVSGVTVKKPLVQTVTGGQSFKGAIDADTTLSLTQTQKDGIKALFNGSMMANQDASSQKAVKKIKAAV
jgi:hypothetical protein